MLTRLINLSFALKMALIALLVVIAVWVPSRNLYQNLSESIAFTDQEVRGMAPADAVLQLNLQVLRWQQGKGSRAALDQQLQVQAQQLAALWPQSTAATLASDISAQWLQRAEPTPAQIDLLLQQLNTELMNAILETSGLSYDPVAASYHYIVAAYQQMPRVQHQLARIQQAASDLAERQLAYQLLIAPFADVMHNISQAQQADATVAQQAMGEQQAALQQGMQQLGALMTPQADPVLVRAASAALLDTTVSLNGHIGDVLHQLMQQRASAAHQQQQGLVWGLVALMLITAVFGSFLVVTTNKAMQQAVATAHAIASGDFSKAQPSQRLDEVGVLQQALWQMNGALQQAAEQADALQQRTAADAERAQLEVVQARENGRIRQALDESSTQVLIADRQGLVVYANHAMEKLLRQLEPVLRARHSEFNAEQVVGAPLEWVYRVYGTDLLPLELLLSRQTEELELAGMQLRVIASPIRSADGERLGTVLEWQNRTAEVQAEQEIAQAVRAAAQGDFSVRLREQGKQGFFLELAKQLNVLMDQSAGSLRAINQVLQALADGDLTQRVQQQFQGDFDLLKQNCNQSCDNLARLINSLRSVAQGIHTAAGEISQGNSDLSSRTEQQASSLEQTASAMDELSGTVQTNAHNAQQAAMLAQEARGIADENGQLVHQMAQTMAGIQQAARHIADIIGVIDGIAFQTNILALNAAVEAARAGDEGRGFAVVASEVRTLAQRSATAAKDIKHLIDDTVRQINVGNVLAGKSGGQVERVVSTIREVSVLMADIARASGQQAAGIGEVAQAISQMDGMTQQNAALVEQASAAAESLNNQAQQLFGQIAAVRVSDDDQGLLQNLLAAAAKPVVPAKTAVTKTAVTKTVHPAKPLRRGGNTQPLDDEWESF